MNKILLTLATLLLAGLGQAGELQPYDGEALPGFTLSDMAGGTHTLGEYRGKVVMVNFWATYCGPCIREIPSMQRLKAKLGDKPFEILAINMAEEQEDVAAFLQRHQIEANFPLLLDPDGAVIEQWMIAAVPTTFILAPDGTFRYALYGGLEWDGDEVVARIEALF